MQVFTLLSEMVRQQSMKGLAPLVLLYAAVALVLQPAAEARPGPLDKRDNSTMPHFERSGTLPNKPCNSTGKLHPRASVGFETPPFFRLLLL